MENKNRAKEKNPLIAAFLGLVLGPVGYLYIGWRFFIMGQVAVVLFILALMIVNLDPAILSTEASLFLTAPLFLVYAWKSYQICSVRNWLIDIDAKQVKKFFDSFPVAVVAMSDLLVGMGMVYAGSIGIYVSIKTSLVGNIPRGFVYLVIGTPILVWIAHFVFGLIAKGINTLFARGRENIFSDLTLEQ